MIGILWVGTRILPCHCYIAPLLAMTGEGRIAASGLRPPRNDSEDWQCRITVSSPKPKGEGFGRPRLKMRDLRDQSVDWSWQSVYFQSSLQLYNPSVTLRRQLPLHIQPAGGIYSATERSSALSVEEGRHWGDGLPRRSAPRNDRRGTDCRVGLAPSSQ